MSFRVAVDIAAKNVYKFLDLMAAVAQLVERQIVALNVAGSIPVGRPIHSSHSQTILLELDQCKSDLTFPACYHHG